MPYDLYKSAVEISKPAHMIYAYSMTSHLVKLSEFYHSYCEQKGIEIDWGKFPSIWELKLIVDHVRKSSNPIEYSERFTMKCFPEKGDTAKEYIANLECVDHLQRVSVPTMMISAKNDPTSNFSMMPWDLMKANSNIVHIYTPLGGHLEFMCDMYRNRWYKYPMT